MVPCINRKKVMQGLVVAMLCLLVYWPSLKNGYIWDDDQYVYNNPAVTRPGGLKDIWLTHDMPQYYPLVFTSFRLEHMIWGANPAGYHAVNLALHTANALLVLAVFSALAPGIAFATALLFAVHPVQVETVAWITERKNLLALFFLLMATLWYLRFYRTGSIGRYIGTLLFYLCALLSKSAAAWFAVVPLVFAWWKTGRATQRDLLTAAPLLITGAAAGLHTAWLEATRVGAAGELWHMGLVEHLLLAARIFVFYLYKVLAPFEFIFFYPRWTIDATVWWQWIFPVLVAGMVAGSIAFRKQTRRAGPGLMILYGAALFPVMRFFNVYPMRFSFVADHFAYLATPVIFAAVVAGVCLAGGAINACFFAETRSAGIFQWAGRTAAVAVIVLLSLKSMGLVDNYRNEITLWKSVTAKNPAAYAAWNNLGSAYGKIGRHHAALPCFEQAMTLRPDLARHAVNLGNALLNVGDAGRALPVLQQAVTLAPDNGEAHHLAAIACFNLGLFDCARTHCQKALDLGTPVKPELIKRLAGIAGSRNGCRQ